MQTPFAEKIKVEGSVACAQTKLNSGTNQSLVIVCTQAKGSVTFQNIFSSIMTDFRAVVPVLPCSPTNKGKKNLCGCAEEANRQ